MSDKFVTLAFQGASDQSPLIMSADQMITDGHLVFLFQNKFFTFILNYPTTFSDETSLVNNLEYRATPPNRTSPGTT